MSRNKPNAKRDAASSGASVKTPGIQKPQSTTTGKLNAKENRRRSRGRKQQVRWMKQQGFAEANENASPGRSSDVVECEVHHKFRSLRYMMPLPNPETGGTRRWECRQGHQCVLGSPRGRPGPREAESLSEEFSVHSPAEAFSRQMACTANASADQVAIFLDAENLGHFLKRQNGAEKLIKVASEFGSPIVRKAFGDWSQPGVNTHQALLVQNGFQLVHTPHPVSKRSKYRRD